MEDLSIDRRADRMAGVSLATAAVLFTGIMAQDPMLRVTDAARSLSDLKTLAASSGAVNAVVLALLALMLFGLIGLADNIGLRSTRVRLGLIAWSAALAFLAANAVLGFVVPELARVYMGAASDDSGFFHQVLWLFRVSSIILVKLALAAGSVALIAWALALFGRNRMTTPAAIAGATIGILPPLALAAGMLHLDTAGRTLVLGLQSAWLVWAATLLYMGRLGHEAAPGAATAGA